MFHQLVCISEDFLCHFQAATIKKKGSIANARNKVPTPVNAIIKTHKYLLFSVEIIPDYIITETVIKLKTIILYIYPL